MKSNVYRNSSIELYRIIAMILIIAHHYVVNSGLIDIMENDPFSTTSVFYYISGAWGKTCINCFVFITGWFMLNKDFSLSKILKLIVVPLFYKPIIYLIFVFSGHTEWNTGVFCMSLLPVNSINYDFVGCFILFYFLIPFLNKLVYALIENDLRNLVLLLLFYYSFFPLFITVSVNYITWFCIIYLLSCYSKLYLCKYTIRWGLLFLISLLVSVSSIVFNLYVGNDAYFLLSDSNMILALITAYTSFMFVSKYSFYNKYINLLSSATFGVLLIHATNGWMRNWLWRDVIKCTDNYNNDYYWLYMWSCVIIIYVICAIIELVRIKIFKKIWR